MTDYQKDFYSWTCEQAELLKAGRFNELDVVNLIEEIETMGRSEKRELESCLAVLLVHLLKWQYQPTRRGRSWQLTIQEQRLEFFDVLNDNPGLKPQLQALLLHAYQKAKIRASKETGLDLDVFPSDCPWEFAQLIDDAFLAD
ncbi:MAG: DUF29 domain-containing protein [Methylococcales bacterium]|nr:DUF29 domain-containing protein [Methylococcales bacterium]